MMLISRDLRPERQVYYAGSVLLEILFQRGTEREQRERNRISAQSLYREFRERTGAQSELFFLALDWLFLLGIVNSEGEVVSNVSAETPDHE
jgi:hypothetical protein